VNDKGEVKKLYKVEQWTDKEITYWTQTEDDSFILDFSYAMNPSPHWITENEALKTKEAHSWGRVPFVPLMNNSKGQNDLDEIKALIDVYDRVYNGWADDIEDFAEQILVVKNLAIKDREFHKGMKELNLFMRNLKESRVVTVDGDGDVKSIKTEIPVEAKEKFLKLTREAIFYFGQGVDVSSERFGNSPSGVALQHLYALLDMKCNRTALKLQKALAEFFWFVTAYINTANNKSYDPYDITVTLNQSMIFNKKETIDGIMARDYISTKTKLSLDPDVEDVQEEMERLEAERGEIDEAGEDDSDPAEMEDLKVV
jgi:SPP1 family phage portal protein